MEKKAALRSHEVHYGTMELLINKHWAKRGISKREPAVETRSIRNEWWGGRPLREVHRSKGVHIVGFKLGPLGWSIC